MIITFFGQTVNSKAALNCQGFSVTIPHRTLYSQGHF